MAQSTIIFKTRSFQQDVILFFFRALLIAGIIYFLYWYPENPVLLGILAGICFLVFITAGTDTLVITNEKLILKNDSIIHLFEKKTIYPLKEIRHFEAKGAFTAQDIFAHRIKRNNIERNAVKLIMMNGETILTPTNIYIGSLKDAESVINKLLNQKD